MDQRKLIKLGNSSFAIALPKNWIDKSGLKKGDNIFITPNSNGELIVQPSYKKDFNIKEKIMSVEGMNNDEIGRNLVSSYVGGSKLIRVIGDKSELKIVKQKAKSFLNLELIEEGEKDILLKDLLDLEDVGLDNFIRRIDNNLKDMLLILSNIINDGKRIKERTKEISEIDQDVTKFYFLIWRIMNLGVDNPAIQANLKISPSLLVVYFWISYNLEQIGDEIKRIAKISERLKNKKELSDILRLLSNNYNESMKSFFNKDKDIARNILSKNNSVIKNIEGLSKINGLGVIAEKLQQINANIHRNAKMMFYNL